MAGIYLHIPFCKKRCNYCDFYKTTNISLKSDFLFALENEISQRSESLKENKIDSIYFGGGTPSVLSIDEIYSIFNLLEKYIVIDKVKEITMEVNPDDFVDEWGRGLKNITPVNRLSFGLQSNDDHQLRIMGRRHSAKMGFNAIFKAAEIGFDNITVDLIYGLPALSINDWEHTLNETLKLPIKHLSAYHLTYEEGTPFFNDLKKGHLAELDDKDSLNQFELLISQASNHGFNHYEISNFSKSGFESLHNSNYWTGKSYYGFGPSAHSFEGNERRWNSSNIAEYMKQINSGEKYFETEFLSVIDRYNELLMLGLRTVKGVDINTVIKLGSDFETKFKKSIKPFIESGKIIKQDDFYNISPSSKFVTDGIIQKLFMV